MAEGGVAERFCSANRSHNPECQYFVDGGEAINPDEVQVDSEVPANEVKTDPDIPSNEVQVDSEIKPDEVVPDNQYNTPEQGLKAVAEGALKGAVGPFAVPIETRYLGVKPEDIAGRAATHPLKQQAAEAATLVGSVLSGFGAGASAARGAAAIAPEAIPILGKLGSAAIKSGIEMGLLQGSDEISKSLLGQGDPEAPVSSALANVGINTLLGVATGGVFNFLGRGVESGPKALQANKLGTKINDFMAGVGAAAEHEKNTGKLIDLSAESAPSPPKEKYSVIDQSSRGAPPPPKEIHSGIKFYNEGISKSVGAGVKLATDYAAGKAAETLEGPIGGTAATIAANAYIAPLVEKYLGRPLTEAAKKTIIPAVLRTMASGRTQGLLEAIDQAERVFKGAKHITNGIEACFKPLAQQTYDYVASDRDKQKLKEFIEQGGVDRQIQNQMQHDQQAQPQGFAEGGHVDKSPQVQEDSNHLAHIFPEQTSLLSEARGRISNYLNSIRPLPNSSKLPYDKEPEQKEKERSYNKALNIAVKPLSILKHIQTGAIEPEQIKHANALYPELMNHLRKEMTKRITKSQVDKEIPTYKVRQGMSMFLGAPLDSTMTQPGIALAQSVFMQKQAQQQQSQPAPKGKKNKSSLSKLADSYRTDDQARMARGQNA